MYIVKFERSNFYFKPQSLKEIVYVIVDIDIPYNNENIEEFEDSCWEQLWKQYPIWACPYNQSNPPPQGFETWRHNWSSASMREVQEIRVYDFGLKQRNEIQSNRRV